MARCPDEAELAAFAERAAPDGQARAITDHVQGCETCSSWLVQARQDDDLLVEVRDAVTTQGEEAPRTPVRVPREIGGFRIGRKLGEGGMGVVYEAEQDHPRRTVALKVMRHALPSERALRRFEHEVEVLAQLSHPGIAQVYETGTFGGADGTDRQPFFAMELVRGEPLLQQTERFELPARLELFVAICNAVQHAHQKAVLHRDLKPANVLVDTRGTPKVLDFGVARVMSGSDVAESLRTLPGQLVGTVPYMSPEQIRDDPRLLDARSDVYSLGVMLYEIIAGRLPHDLEDQTLLEQSRIVCEHEPARLGSVCPAARGDLETIVHKALEKDRERRYASVSELGADVERFLRNEPITARPASTVYQLRKFASRNRTLVGGIAAVFLVLVGGIAATWTQAVRADRKARDERERADQAAAARDFLQEVLVLASPTEHGEREPTIGEALEIALERVDRHLIGQPVVEAAVRHTLGRVLLAMQRTAAARGHLERALELYESADRSLPAQLVYVLADLSSLYRRDGEFDAAIEAGKRAIGMRDVLGPEHDFILLVTLDSVGLALFSNGRLDEAETCFREAVALAGTLEVEREANVASMEGHLALALHERGRLEEAAELYEKALGVQRRVHGDRSRTVATTLGNFAGVLRDQGQYEEAASRFREALEIDAGRSGERSVQAGIARMNLGLALADLGSQDEAIAELRLALEVLRAELDRHPRVVNALHALGSTLAGAGRAAEAESLLREALAMGVDTIGARHFLTNRARRGLGTVLIGKSPQEAADLLAEALEIIKTDTPHQLELARAVEVDLGRAMSALGRYEEAESALTRVLEASERAGEPDDSSTAQAALQALVDLYEAWGEPERGARYAARLVEGR